MAITRPTRRADAPVAGRARHGLARWPTSLPAAQPHRSAQGARAGRSAGLLHSLFAGATIIAAATSTLAVAQTWKVTPGASLEWTFTDNVNLAPDDQSKADWVTQLTPSVRFTETSAHTRLAGSIALPILLYARTSENNYVAPEVSITGTVETLDRFFFVDASANVSQQYRTPFGALPNNLANATNNRYTSQSYT